MQAGSPAIDAADPGLPFDIEPAENGSRANAGAFGNTSDAATSLPGLRLLTLNGFDKVEVGVPQDIGVQSNALSAYTVIAQVNAGSSNQQGVFEADAVRTNGFGTTNPTSNDILGLSSISPNEDVFRQVGWGRGGTPLQYDFDVPDGTYLVRLHLIDIRGGNGIMDIVANGVTRFTDFDIEVEAGGLNTAMVLDFEVTATGGTGIALEFLGDTFFQNPQVAAIEIAQEVGVAPDPLLVEASYDGGATWETVDDTTELNPFGLASILWTPTQETGDHDALIRVSTGSASVTSRDGILVANNGTMFFVNDGDTTGDVYTTAIGDNRNSGKSPDAPMADLGALLRAYDLEAGDVVYVDAGTYVVPTEIVLAGDDSGTGDLDNDRVRILGPTGGVDAVFDRQSDAQRSAIFDVQGAEYVTLSDLTLTGGDTGVRFQSGQASQSISLQNLTIFDVDRYGVSVSGTAHRDLLITGASITDQDGDATSSAAILLSNVGSTTVQFSILTGFYEGLRQTGGNGTYLFDGLEIAGNRNVGVWLNSTFGDVTLRDSVIRDNDALVGSIGVYATGNNTQLVGNTIFGHDFAATVTGLELRGRATAIGNEVYENYRGVEVAGGNTTLEANRIFANIGAGIYLGSSGGRAERNTVYSNQTGIEGVAGGSAVTLIQNIIYDNDDAGVSIERGQNVQLIGNTIVQEVGTGIELDDSNAITLVGNIVQADAGFVLGLLNGASNEIVASDQNLFYRGTGGVADLAFDEGVILADLAAWQTATGLDAQSVEADPMFIDPSGADDVLGGLDTPTGGGSDDNFGLKSGSPAIDAANDDLMPLLDALGRQRVDDPATPNTGGGTVPFIDIGALEFQGDSGDTAGPLVVAVNGIPAEGESTDAQITAIDITFSESLDAVSASSATNYLLEGAGLDGVFATADDVQIALVPSYVFGSTDVRLDLIGGPLDNDLYRLTLSGSKAIFDTSANALDGDADGTPGGDFTRNFTVSLPNVAPVINQVAPISIDESQLPLSIPIVANDADGDVVTLSLIAGPAGATLSGADVIWTPSDETATPASFTVRATEQTNEALFSEMTFTVDVQNVLPVITSLLLPPNTNAGQTVTLDASIVDPGADTLTATVDWGDGTVTQPFDATGGTAQVTHSYVAPGTFTGTFTVTDGDGAPVAQTFSITVSPANAAPQILPVADRTVSESDQPILVPITAVDPNGDGITLSLVAGPPGAQINGNVVSWIGDDDTPAPASFTVRATEQTTEALFSEMTFNITVLNVAPVIGQVTVPTLATEGETVSLSAPVADPGADTLTATIDWGDGTSTGPFAVVGGVVSAQYAYPSVGTYSGTISVSDGDGAPTTASFSITIEEAQGSTTVRFDTENEFEWDSITSRFDADGELIDRLFTYDDPNRPDDLFTYTESTNDQGQRVRTIVSDIGNDGSPELRTETTFDGSGIRVEEIDTDISPGNAAYSWTTIVKTFDGEGRLITQLNDYDDGRRIEIAYSAGVRVTQTETFADGRVSTTQYVNGVRASKVQTDPNDAVAWERVEQTFDSVGRLISQINDYDDGRRIEITYNAGARVTQTETFPDGSQRITEYGPGGVIVNVIDIPPPDDGEDGDGADLTSIIFGAAAAPSLAHTTRRALLADGIRLKDYASVTARDDTDTPRTGETGTEASQDVLAPGVFVLDKANDTLVQSDNQGAPMGAW